MESINHPIEFGKTVKSIRKKKGMNQVEFYKYLFPDTLKEDENIKKKMNSIENGKQASVDFDFFLELCHKCDASADYLIGKESVRNYDVKEVCNYTGLSEKAVVQLHRWQLDANTDADLSIIGSVYVGDDGDLQMDQAFSKQTALQFLKILNCLFDEGETKEKVWGKTRKVRYSNVGVLYSLYLLSMSEPVRITGKLNAEETFDGYEEFLFSHMPHLKTKLDRVVIDPSALVMFQDDSEVWYPLDMKKIMEQIGRRHLDESINRLLKTIKKGS